MAVMVPSIAKDDLGQDGGSEEADEVTEEAPDNESEETEDESPDHIRDTREALEEAFAALSMDELKEIAMRLTKCNEGFYEMLHEAEQEQEELRQEAAQLNESISFAMQDIHRQETAKSKPPDVAVAEAGQKAVQTLQHLHQKAVKKATGLVDKGSDLINAAKTKHAEVVAAREERRQTAKQKKQAAANKRQSKSSASQRTEEKKKEQKTNPGEANKTQDSPTEASPANDGAAGPQAPADVILKKTKPVLSTDSTVVIEARVTTSDGKTHTLHVRMADSCEEAGHRFIHEHSQRAWYTEPLIAWLKRAEADATKLPLRVEASLSELRKQHNKAAAPAAQA